MPLNASVQETSLVSRSIKKTDVVRSFLLKEKARTSDSRDASIVAEQSEVYFFRTVDYSVETIIFASIGYV